MKCFKIDLKRGDKKNWHVSQKLGNLGKGMRYLCFDPVYIEPSEAKVERDGRISLEVDPSSVLLWP